MLKKVISGGQSGADKAGLEAAKYCHLETGGTAPKYFMTENGPDFELRDFKLIEGPNGYTSRTIMNVDDSDATLVFRFHPSVGTDKTIGYCLERKWCVPSVIPLTNWHLPIEKEKMLKYKSYKPLFIVDTIPLFSLDDFSQYQLLIKSIKNFLLSNDVSVLNVAGHRESSSKVNNFKDVVKSFLIHVFN